MVACPGRHTVDLTLLPSSDGAQSKSDCQVAPEKKKKKLPLDTWSLSSRRVHAGGNAWFSSDPGLASDTYLATQPLTLPADGRNLQLVFYHMFEFEYGAFDGGVLEISTGGDFEDLGAKIIKGGYTGTIWESASSPLAGRSAWVNGRLGTYQQVIVDLSSYAGKTVTIKFLVGQVMRATKGQASPQAAEAALESALRDQA